LGDPRRHSPFPTRRSSDLGESRERHEPAPTAFSPYVTRVHAEMTGVSPEWVSPEPTVDAMARVDSRRYPSVVVEKLAPATSPARSEEHTSELQSRENLVCR